MSLTQTELLRPQLFVTRQNGTMVPLVAVDELPSTMSVRGVPRTLSPHDISGMTGVGTFNSRHRQYVVDGLNRRHQAPPISGDRSLMGSSFAMPAKLPLKNDLMWGMNCAPVFPVPPKAYGIQEQHPSNPKMPLANMWPSSPEPLAATGESDLPPFHNMDELPIGRATGIKEYCSYWLRHGECDYAQQGCLYRHEMPLDRPTLEKLGLRDIPRWYREKHCLSSYLAGGNTMIDISASSPTKPNLMERNWRSRPTEVSLDGTGRKPEEEIELPSTSKSSPTEQRSTRSSTSHNLPPKPTVSTAKPVVSTPTPVNSTPKPTYHAILSRRQPSPAAYTKARATTTVPEEETASARYIRETIRMLDAYDQRERDRLSEKYQILEPQKSGTTNTASTSTASSTGGGAEGDELAEDVVVAKERLQSTKPSSVSTSTPLSPVAANLRPMPVVKKRTGKPKRRGRNGRENGSPANGRDRMKVERLVDHD